MIKYILNIGEALFSFIFVIKHQKLSDKRQKGVVIID